jgi:predicted amidohydrolase
MTVMPEGPRLRVAVAQVESVLGDLPANIDKHLAFIAKAREAGAQVVLFPEMSLTGHSAGAETLRVALGRDDPAIKRLAGAAQGLRAIFGLIEEGPAAQFYNSQFVVADGEIEFIHRKINLAPTDVSRTASTSPPAAMSRPSRSIPSGAPRH